MWKSIVGCCLVEVSKCGMLLVEVCVWEDIWWRREVGGICRNRARTRGAIMVLVMVAERRVRG